MSEQKSVEANTIKASLSDSDVSFSSSANAPPVVQVTELSDGLYHIKCAFKISDPDDLGWGIQEETFQLDNYSSCCPFYKLTLMCHHRDPQPDQYWGATEFPCQVWIKFYQSVGEINAHRQFTNLFRNQLNCDVTINFDEIEEDESIGGHAIILSARSSVFAAMFQCGMQEANTRKVCIKDIKPDIFKQLLHYIYSGRISTKLSEEIAQPVYVAADMYGIEDLAKECVRFLLSCIKLENVINLMAWAHVHSVDSIKEAALDFVESHGKEICHQDDWERLMKNYPDLCLLATRRMWK